MTLLAREQEPGSTFVVHPGADGAGVVRRTVLPGGLRIVTETVPTVRSVAFGIWAGVGSRDESIEDAGASHYLEHLLFKGTRKRTALEISSLMDAAGGEMNAFTAKEYTCYYARVLDSDMPLAIDVVSDMVTDSLIEPQDVDAERGVILEEIAMHDDDPTDAVHDEFSAALFGDTPLGRPILGTVESISGIGRDRIARYYRERYVPQNLVVAAAGNVDHDEVVRLVQAAFAGVLGDASQLPSAPRIGGPGASPASGVRSIVRPTEQANLILGSVGITRVDERRFALGVLNAALGGGMSSRLFQEIREKRGLAYSVYSYNSQYADTGIFGVYAGCLPAKVDEVLEICRDEVAKVAEHGITEEELERGKGQLRGSFVLGLEDTGSRMSRIGKSELVYDSLLSVDDILGRIEAVTLDDVRTVGREILGRPMTMTVIGPFEGRDFTL
ncbi:M16 family metallopeptidase [Actinoallomurus rhizosphaericola]|uniref:M16 family metallopeptidase n=1 Tax=Actinoallomurus rhizosphaericola TaxID=2952536 RepID=UPI002091B592|nr:pitrilysin family protein [Actinoallomurus rhizosphaericola]MCO5992325.1 insulinase family protein [Actinoallomurus rhizosphaericola]